MPVLHCHKYYSFVVNFEVGKCESSNSFLLLKDSFSYSELLVFLYKLRVSLLISGGGKASLDFVRVCSDSIDQLREHCHLNNSKSSDSWTWGI